MDARAVPSRWRFTYALELFGDGVSRFVNLPLNPQAYEDRALGAVEVTPTAGGVGVSEGGFLMHDLVVRGTTGLTARRGWSASGELTYGDGHELFEELVKLFDDYSQAARGLSKMQLAWHDFVRDRHYIVVPLEVGISRDATQHRIHRPYELRLRAVAPYLKTKSGFFDSGILGDIKRGFAEAQKAVRLLTGALADARAFLDEADRYVTGLARTVLGSIDELLAAAVGVQTGVKRTLDLPRRLALQTGEAVARWRAEVETLTSAGAWQPDPDAPWQPPAERSDEPRTVELLDRVGQLEDGLTALLADADLWQLSFEARAEGRAVASSTAVTSMTAPTYAALKPYTVRPGDTLLAIASRELGSPDLWPSLLDANPGLLPPYLGGLPGTLGPGDTLLLPALASDPTALGSSPRTEEEALDAVLGVDFELTEDGEWTVDETRCDVRRVRGVANYVQAFERIQFKTRPGANPLFPRVGIEAPVGAVNGRGQPAAVALSLRAAIARDARTASVGPVELVDLGDGMAVTVTARVRGVGEVALNYKETR